MLSYKKYSNLWNNQQSKWQHYFTVVTLGTVFSVLPQLTANAVNIKLAGTLEGSQEVPPVVTSAMGSIMATLTGDLDSFVFSYEITYSDLSSVIIPAAGTGGHIHMAPVGINGGIVHTLDTSPFNYTGTTEGTIVGDWRFDDATDPLTNELAQSLLTDGLYVNLHTEQNSSGELRGQINRVPEPTAIWGATFALGLGALVNKNRLVNKKK